MRTKFNGTQLDQKEVLLDAFSQLIRVLFFLSCYNFHVFGGKKNIKFSLHALLKLTQNSLTSKDFAFELNMHLGPLTEREISDLNLSKILKLLSQFKK